GFIGSPSMNFFPCALRSGEGGVHLVSPWFRIPIAEQRELRTGLTQARSASEGTSPRWRFGLVSEVLLGVRPHDITLVDPGDADAVAGVDVIQPLGSEMLIHLHLTGNPSALHV